MIQDSVIKEWSLKKKHIRDRINRIDKRIKKLQKQKKHFELRLKLVSQYDKEKTNI